MTPDIPVQRQGVLPQGGGSLRKAGDDAPAQLSGQEWLAGGSVLR
jgi:hypothetical protein